MTYMENQWVEASNRPDSSTLARHTFCATNRLSSFCYHKLEGAASSLCEVSRPDCNLPSSNARPAKRPAGPLGA